MFKEPIFLYLYTETPLHPGSGTSVSWVDLPIQREKHTEYPIVQGSGLKGCLRDQLETLSERQTDPKQKDSLKKWITSVFGPDPESQQADKHGGCLTLTDAGVLLFPVRSFSGVFAWVTSPRVLAGFHRKAEMAGFAELPAVPDPPGLQEVWVCDPCGLKTTTDAVILEDMAFQPKELKKNGTNLVNAWAKYLGTALPDAFLKNRLESHLAIIHDDVFQKFALFSTDVATRISIGESGTVESGMLWTEELLPSDCLFYSLALAADPKPQAPKDTSGKPASASDVRNFLIEKVRGEEGGLPAILQLGGDETVGRGLVWATSVTPPPPRMKKKPAGAPV